MARLAGVLFVVAAVPAATVLGAQATPAALQVQLGDSTHAMAAAGAAAPFQSADQQRIREARARSNAAIAAHDTAAMARVWMETLHVVSSTSDQIAGRAENQRRLAQQFARRPDLVYVRQPSTVEVYPPWDVAAERGEWTGRWTDSAGVVEIGGTYLAQWRKIGGAWLIQAELYVPLRCNGHRYCGRRP